MKSRILLATLCWLSTPVHAEYFLDWSQKGELISRGEITGRDQMTYSVWIVPGYEAPFREGAEAWRDSGSAIGEYVDSALYRDMGNIVDKSWHFASEDILWNFALDGTVDSWMESFKDAQGRTEKRVFGWWFAYPWALIEGTASTLLRVGLGVPGSVIVAAGGATVVPAGRWLIPAGKSVFYAAVPGVVLPTIAVGWDAMVAPPLAMLGQQPTVERADGFWLKQIEPESADEDFIAGKAAFERWKNHLTVLPEIAEKRRIQEAFLARQKAEMSALAARQQKEFSEFEAQMSQQRFEALQRVVTREGLLPAGITQEQVQQWVSRYGKEPFLTILLQGMTTAEAEWYLGMILRNMPAPREKTLELRRDDERTDPVRRSVELLGR